ncbi:McrB family protein [Vibrio crassostreae]|uniref:McrB family protein n=1 Tax=Vibrio crassostreae TaxID=246167 RepID=UPI0010446803|nr:AAA family ATPase [Vibrio crassostreae]TCT61576.1 5-methylcytosine-specific restriction protein B [Vibrio crassostreae]
MSEYLLTWNPKHFITGGDGNESGKLDYEVGDEVRWSCHSKKPKKGDVVYLIRLGTEPRGIIARGKVTKESYLDSGWKNPEKQTAYIQFELEDIRHSCEEGLLPMLLLNSAMPDQQWSPQTSGILVKNESKEVLAELWEAGKNKHAFTQFLCWDKKHHFNPNGWYKDYQDTCQLVKQIKEGKTVSEEDVHKLWYEKANGIASVGQGFMYQRELSENAHYLYSLTEEIIKAPSKETYDRIIKNWRTDGKFDRVLWTVIHRLFGAASPEQYTSIAGRNYLSTVIDCLEKQFQLSIKPIGNWIIDNQKLVEVVNALIPVGWDVHTRNIHLWNLYEWATKRHKKTEDMDQIQEDGEEYRVEKEIASSSQNVIFFGPPGTGKTYKLQQLQAKYTSQTESADASLWLQEKIAPLNWMQVLVLSLLSLGKKAKVSDIVASKYFQTKAKVNNRDGNLSQTAWSYLQKFTVSNSTTVNYKGRGEPAVFDKTSDSVWHLLDDKLELVDELLVLHKELEQGPPPGTVVKRFSSTTFHQSYGYEEFIEGLRASTDGEGNVHYSVDPGEFLKLCRRAEQDPDSQYAMFIDEINRGNISKIFGELISLVETDKRKDGAHPMSVNLAYSGRPFSVPSNVDIIGTMNTADRSIALMDTALRRRFEFIEMMPDIRLFESDGLIDIGNNQHIDLAELLKSLNDRIEALYDREHTLGHAFFFPTYNAAKAGNHDEALSNLAKAFIGKIVPLLQEYFHDNWSKIRLVLGDNQKLGSDRKELQALQFVRREKVEYQRLFGNQYEPDGYASDEYRYTLADQNDDIWTNGECYLAIYKPQLTEVLAAQVMDEN